LTPEVAGAAVAFPPLLLLMIALRRLLG